MVLALQFDASRKIRLRFVTAIAGTIERFGARVVERAGAFQNVRFAAPAGARVFNRKPIRIAVDVSHGFASLKLNDVSDSGGDESKGYRSRAGEDDGADQAGE